jgi:hypothetical protein
MWLIINSFIVFSLTLILTKSKVLAGKREFVEQRYEASKVGDQQPGWIHRWWHAMWTCPMCSGFWVSIPICFFYPAYGIFADVLVVFGVNWLLHCLENLLFFSGEVMKYVDELDLEEHMKSQKDFREHTGSILRKAERNFRDLVEKHSK